MANKTQLNAIKDCVLVRVGNNCILEPMDTDLKEKHGDKYQVLCYIKKNGNTFSLDGTKPEDPLADVDDWYSENGRANKEPVEMKERLYHAIRFLYAGNAQRRLINDRNDTLLKKNDIIKLGRIKLKVKAIVSQKKIAYRHQLLMRRRERIAYDNAKRGRVRVKDNNSASSSQLEGLGRYPRNYDQLSDESQISINDPIVGEINSIRALTPVKKSKKKLLKREKRKEERKKKEEEAKKRAELMQLESSVPDKKSEISSDSSEEAPIQKRSKSLGDEKGLNDEERKNNNEESK